MGANDDREMLEVAKEECGRLERENAELRAEVATTLAAGWGVEFRHQRDSDGALIGPPRTCTVHESPGFTIVSRHVGPWLPVTPEPKEN